MKEIPLTQGKFAIVDDENHEKLTKRKWCAIYLPKQNTYYAKSNKEYMHRFITECPKDKEVDHINHNTLDNRRENLRVVNRGRNNANRFYSRKVSKYRGVAKQKKNNTWMARIWINKKLIHLGTYKTQELAAQAYLRRYRKEYNEDPPELRGVQLTLSVNQRCTIPGV